MATTDAKPAFRLPWTAETRQPGDPADRAQADTAGSAATLDTDQAEHDLDHGPDGASGSDSAAVSDSVGHGDGAAPNEAPSSSLADAPQLDPAAAQLDPAAALTRSSPAPSGAARKPNTLMAGLARAMQAAAETARTESLARFSQEAKSHIEGIHAASASEATELRKRADDDVAALRDWSKLEIVRLRDETEVRITERKLGLDAEIERQAASIAQRIERVQARVAGFEVEMAGFFASLQAETDPTRLAALAETLPEPPSFELDDPAADAPEPATEPPPDGLVMDRGVGAESATEPDPGAVSAALDPDFAAAEAEAAALSSDELSEDDVPTIADDALAARLAGLVPATRANAQPASTTRVVVLGLVSVASIAGFKRQLSRLAGVQSVGVSSGPEGEFIFTVGHGSDLSLPDALPGLSGFAARLTAETEGELRVTARDPETEL